jgi:3-oxoacyl-[acyl-carrier-protein] synthase I
MIYVEGYGFISAAGPTAWTSVAGVNTGTSFYNMSSTLNKNGYPMRTAEVPADVLPEITEKKKYPLTQKEKRLIQLTLLALKDIQPAIKLDSKIPLFLAGPETTKLFSGARNIILNYIAELSEIKIDLQSSRYLASGRTGVIEAIELAHRYFEIAQSDYVLIAGVDSYLDAETLGQLDVDDRVSAENILDGFIPGEAGGVLLVSRSKISETSIGLHRPGLGIEEGSFYSEKPYFGNGLAGAVAQAISQSGSKVLSRIYSSFNGESYFSKEYGVSIIRNSQFFAKNYDHIHPADCWGDIGAATGVGLITLSAGHLYKNQDVNYHLVFGSSDGGNRAAVCVERA